MKKKPAPKPEPAKCQHNGCACPFNAWISLCHKHYVESINDAAQFIVLQILNQLRKER